MKRMWNKITCLLLTAALAAGMCAGCSPRKKAAGGSGKLSIVATVFPQYDFARQIAGDRADVTMLLKPGMEAHSYEPSPKDIIGISQCDLFLNVGGESESWLDSVLESADNHAMKIVSALDCVDPLEEETVEGMQSKEHHHAHEHDHDHGEEAESEDHEEDHDGDEEEEYDEHVWTSPMNAIAIVNRINGALCEIDPDNAEYYCGNTARYVAELMTTR